jgi:adenylate kinase family enzyme
MLIDCMDGTLKWSVVKCRFLQSHITRVNLARVEACMITFIIGYSGSGKSTYARKFIERGMSVQCTDRSWMRNLLREHGYSWKSDKEYREVMHNHGLAVLMDEYHNKDVVIEGVSLLLLNKEEMMKSGKVKVVLIKTGFWLSTWRACLRNFNGLNFWQSSWIRKFKTNVKLVAHIREFRVLLK